MPVLVWTSKIESGSPVDGRGHTEDGVERDA
jgi:hypothetical protein